MPDTLDRLFAKSHFIDISEKDKFVIFSDLHLGNRKSRDDFKANSDIFLKVLTDYYYKENYNLILNGDIEELQRVSFKKVYRRWDDLFRIFSLFNTKNNFYKIIGNHDLKLKKINLPEEYPKIYDSLVLKINNNKIFIFHGHQASGYKDLRNNLAGIGLRYALHPLGIKNFTRSYNNANKHSTEQKIYNFSYDNKLISIIGHTHRPLFESLSENDYIKFEIENLIQQYVLNKNDISKLSEIEQKIIQNKNDLREISVREYPTLNSSLYNDEIITPVLFNSGYAIGKKGFTCIEICGGEIRLIHWFSKEQNNKYLKYPESQITELKPYNDIYKITLRKDSLQTIFTKIKLLT